MKTCSICGHQFPDDLKECPVCGAPAPDADADANTTINTNNGTTPPPVPDDIPPVPEVDASPKTRIVSNGTVPPSNPGAVPPSGPATVASGAVPPSNPGAVPPSNPGTVPPSGSFNQPPRRNNTVLWVVIGILSAIILIGATWFIATKVLGDDSKSSDNSEDSIGNDVEVVDYETDDTPTQSDTYDADTLAEPDVEEVYNTDDTSNSHSSSTSSDDNTNVITGYLHHSDGDKSCYVRLVFTVDNDSEVSGTASFNNTTLDISGNYYDGSKKLLIYENGGGRYEGYVNGSTYSGKYYDNDGTWSFSMNVN
ncbi:MAG: hypothetical protein UDM12_00330 [Prevotellamassilia sp.]|nr:hypothetical protein [Prevotellamassilia sp.]